MLHSVATMPAAGGQLDLKGGWNKVWGQISGQFKSLTTLMTSIGVLVIVFAIGKYVWDRRRGGASIPNLVWSLLAGCLLAGPSLLIPTLLGFVDQGARFFNSFLSGSSS